VFFPACLPTVKHPTAPRAREQLTHRKRLVVVIVVSIAIAVVAIADAVVVVIDSNVTVVDDEDLVVAAVPASRRSCRNCCCHRDFLSGRHFLLVVHDNDLIPVTSIYATTQTVSSSSSAL
jgi:hypothetical protein